MLDDGLVLQPVPEQDDLLAFRYDFGLEGKALPEGKSGPVEAVIHEKDNGDLIIRGMAAVFEGVDRQNENFVPGAFQRGIKAFMQHGGGPLNYHHNHAQNIGEVTHLEETPAGLEMEARVDFQEPTSPLRHVYNAIKSGSTKGLSVGGFFKRKLTEAGWRIADMDFTEISVTPVQVHPATQFAVVAGKALEDIEIPSKPDVENTEIRDEDEAIIAECISALERVFARIEKRTTTTS